ncbi:MULTISPECIES: hypothetical protein [Serratia]|uniref:hypothetical protein n=1 Tax=Serratia TaxID=613 RepID=UPI00111393E7|nr:hypothetical protein [Serratia marcescens]
MSYYNSNAIYNNLVKTPNYCWTVGNAWILVYGDHNSDPRLIVFAQGKSWVQDNQVLESVAALANRAGLPTMHIEFDDKAEAIETVNHYINATISEEISLTKLKELFKEHGVPVNSYNFSKAINDKESSAYHKWQRSSLGRITVSDIDLIRIDNQEIMTILELKRSYYTLERWNPFPEDYPNFRLINNVCRRAGLGFIIAYNVRHTRPKFFDDPSQIKLFFYDKNFNVTQEKIVPLSDFVNAKY